MKMSKLNEMKEQMKALQSSESWHNGSGVTARARRISSTQRLVSKRRIADLIKERDQYKSWYHEAVRRS